MELRQEIKKDAKAALRCCWGRAAVLLLTAAAVSLLISLTENLCLTIFDRPAAGAGSVMSLLFDSTPAALITTAAAAAVTLAVQLPFSVGRGGWYYRMAGGENESILSAFRSFSSGRRYGRAIGFQLLLALKRLLWALLFIGPGGAVTAMFCTGWPLPQSVISSPWAGWARVAGLALTLAGALLWLLVIQRYFAALYILSGGSTVREAFALSLHCTRGRHAELLVFELSFIGWQALCFFILPLLFVQPYHCAACAIYARYLIERAGRGLCDE